MSTEVSLAASIDALHRRTERRLFWWSVVAPMATLISCLTLLEGFLVTVLVH